MEWKYCLSFLAKPLPCLKMAWGFEVNILFCNFNLPSLLLFKAYSAYLLIKCVTAGEDIYEFLKYPGRPMIKTVERFKTHLESAHGK